MNAAVWSRHCSMSCLQQARHAWTWKQISSGSVSSSCTALAGLCSLRCMFVAALMNRWHSPARTHDQSSI